MALALWCSACLYGPPILEPPAPIDTPPFWFPDDVEPSQDMPVVVDLATREPIRFELRAVYDWNLGDRLVQRWLVYNPLLPEGVVELRRLELRPRAEQPFPDATVYESASFEALPCAFPLEPRYRTLRVRLEIIDELDVASRDLLGRDRYQPRVEWLVELRGDCPDG